MGGRRRRGRGRIVAPVAIAAFVRVFVLARLVRGKLGPVDGVSDRERWSCCRSAGDAGRTTKASTQNLDDARLVIAQGSLLAATAGSRWARTSDGRRSSHGLQGW